MTIDQIDAYLPPLVPRSFCAEPPHRLAYMLLGKWIHIRGVALRITETEAYDEKDSASHARHGKTKRNAPMWGAPGYSYIYLCYGIHYLFNIVAGNRGRAGGILVRGAEVVKGFDLVKERRKGRDSRYLTGPGKVTQALAIDMHYNRHPLDQTPLTLHLPNEPPITSCWRGSRIGIGYATPKDQQRPWRFALIDHPAVTFPERLQPYRIR